MSKLLPCPFCGAAAMLHPVARDWWRIIVHHEEDCIMGDDHAPTAPQTPEQLELLVGAWNRRATPADHIPQARDEVIEECAKVCDELKDKVLKSGPVHALHRAAVSIRALTTPSDER